jgi:tetratricopeptide (TPR) repeat protein
MMNEVDARRFNDVYSRFDAGDYAQALHGLRELAAGINDPWDKAELLYHEAIFLLEMGKVPEARQRVVGLDKALASLVKSPSDGDEFDVGTSLPVMARHADLKVTIKEGKTQEALRILEDLLTRYPKQLSLPQFQTMSEEVKTLRGLLLGDLGRWEEARPFLEEASPPEVWKSFHRYYLGQSYYELGKYQLAREKLGEALILGLPNSWTSRAHYLLGLVEYNLSEMKAAKREFELSVKTADTEDSEKSNLKMAKTWAYLEATSRALGLQAEAENYRRLRTESLPTSKPN